MRRRRGPSGRMDRFRRRLTARMARRNEIVRAGPAEPWDPPPAGGDPSGVREPRRPAPGGVPAAVQLPDRYEILVRVEARATAPTALRERRRPEYRTGVRPRPPASKHWSPRNPKSV